MNWVNPKILYFIFTIPLLVMFFVWAYRRKQRLLRYFASSRLLKRLAREASLERQAIKMSLIVIGIALIIVALARPQFGAVTRPVREKGLDIIVAIDVSTSMLAGDIKPSRLARAKDQLNILINRLQGDRVGILTFAGSAFMACPLTIDYSVAQMILDTVDTESIPRQGTMIGDAIEHALNAFERSEAQGDKVLVLLTDGEDQGSDPAAAAKKAAEQGVRIYCIGIGSQKGVPIELPDGTYKKDKEGKIVTSRLDFTTLQKIALQTGGKAILSTGSGYLELDEIVKDIADMRRAEFRTRTRTMYEDRFQWALAPAIFLLMIEFLMGDRRRVRQEWRGRFE